MRQRFAWLTDAESVIVDGQQEGVLWWTFAGWKANAALAKALNNIIRVAATSDSLAIQLERALPGDQVNRAIEEMRTLDPDCMLPTVDQEALQGMKFSRCLPPSVGMEVLAARARDRKAVEHVLRAGLRLV